MPTAAIRVDGLVKRYGELVAVDGLDLEVQPGETFALLGPNGAGKTSTVECLEGYRRPDEGTVRVLDLDPIRDGDQLKARMGLMLQEGGMYPTAYPLELLRLFAAFHADPLDPGQLFERAQLERAANTRVRDLSGGQRQRLSLALALVGRPEVVFLDEPTAGLDPQARRSTWEQVRELRADGVTVVLTTHLLDEAEELADRVAIIDKGRLVALGTPDELTHGEHPEVIFSARPGLDVLDLARTLARPVQQTRPGRYAIEAENSPEIVVALATWLAERREVLGELRAGKRSLEDVFLQLTAEDSEQSEGGATAQGPRRRSRRRGAQR